MEPAERHVAYGELDKNQGFTKLNTWKDKVSSVRARVSQMGRHYAAQAYFINKFGEVPCDMDTREVKPRFDVPPSVLAQSKLPVLLSSADSTTQDRPPVKPVLEE